MGRVRCRSRWTCRVKGVRYVGGVFDDDDDGDDNEGEADWEKLANSC